MATKKVSDLSSISHNELQKELNRRDREINNLRKSRQAAKDRIIEIDERLAEVGQTIKRQRRSTSSQSMVTVERMAQICDICWEKMDWDSEYSLAQLARFINHMINSSSVEYMKRCVAVSLAADDRFESVGRGLWSVVE